MMTVSELRRLLTGVSRSTEVRIAILSDPPTQSEANGVRNTYRLLEPDAGVLWIVAGKALGPIPLD